MTSDPNTTRATSPVPRDESTRSYDPSLDAGLAAAFGPDPTPGGWSQPPLMRDDTSDNAPIIHPSSIEMPRGTSARYQMLGEIARGGMGVILKGRDPDLGRDLAFKVLKSELTGRLAAEQRFVEEAQVGGQLQHPGIVPIYDLGRFADGRPYFAMKLVKGDTLADLLTERKSPADNRGHFLQTFFQVCQTVAYAHSRGVVHRDLKPSNVMVGAFGEVLVMDWGLAKVLPRGGVADEQKATHASRERERPEEPTVIHTARSGSGSETEAGSVMGTPAFMSPEQAAGEIDKLDERADVFGLGAVLCVILTGRQPYLAETAEEVRLMAIRGELNDAFARLDECETDAELIALCKRCLASKRDERPRHAGEVAGAMAAYLGEVEQRAHRAEVDRAAATAEAREQRKRRRVQTALGVAFTTLIALGGAFAWWQDRQATAGRAQLARNADALADLVGRCEAALREDDADRATAALAEIDRRLAEGGGEAVADRAARCRADLAILRELDAIDIVRWTPVEDRRTNPKVVAVRWRAAFARYGAAVGSTPVEDAAARVAGSIVRDRLVAALDLWLASDPDPGVRAVLRTADPDPYRDAARDAVEVVARAVAGLSESGRRAILLQDSIGRPFDETARRLGVAPAAARLAKLAYRPEALAQPRGFAAALGSCPAVPPGRRRAVLEAALRSRPGDLALLMGLGATYDTSGSTMTRQAVAAEKARWYQAAVAAHPRNPVAHVNLGSALEAKRDLDGAIACHREAIRLDPTYAGAPCALGLVLCRKGDLDGGIASLNEAVRLDPRNPDFYSNLGNQLRRKGDRDGAIAAGREATRLDPTGALYHVNLGLALDYERDPKGAIAANREAIRLDPLLAVAHSNLGAALSHTRDVDGAIRSLREAIRLDPEFYMAHMNLGLTLSQKKDYDEAVLCLREAVRLAPTDFLAHYNLGTELSRRDDRNGAIACYREAIRLNPKYAYAHSNLGHVLKRTGDLDGAIAACREAIRFDPKEPRMHVSLADALDDKGDWDGAAAAYREAIRLDPKNAVTYHNLVVTLARAGRPAEGLQVTADALRANPSWADDPRHNRRFTAGCFAVNCADGKGPGAPPPAERPGYRKQALDYLTADLAATGQLLAAHPAGDRDFVHQRMRHWLRDVHLASVRDREAIENLPADERVGWVKLWTAVRELRDATAPPETAPPPREVKR